MITAKAKTLVHNYSNYYYKKFEELRQQAEDGGIHVKLVKGDVLKDFVGVNSEAAKALGFFMPNDEIWISLELSWISKYHTLQHEMYELNRMRQGVPYWQAHSEALNVEGG